MVSRKLISSFTNTARIITFHISKLGKKKHSICVIIVNSGTLLARKLLVPFHYMQDVSDSLVFMKFPCKFLYCIDIWHAIFWHSDMPCPAPAWLPCNMHDFA
jgi:hypothetical protein